MIKANVLIDLKFYPSSLNGRQGSTPDDYFGCYFEFNNKNYDGRMILTDVGPISPGDEKKNIPLVFLCPEDIVNQLAIGSKLIIHEGVCIGKAIVTDVF